MSNTEATWLLIGFCLGTVATNLIYVVRLLPYLRHRRQFFERSR